MVLFEWEKLLKFGSWTLLSLIFSYSFYGFGDLSFLLVLLNFGTNHCSSLFVKRKLLKYVVELDEMEEMFGEV